MLAILAIIPSLFGMYFFNDSFKRIFCPVREPLPERWQSTLLSPLLLTGFSPLIILSRVDGALRSFTVFVAFIVVATTLILVAMFNLGEVKKLGWPLRIRGYKLPGSPIRAELIRFPAMICFLGTGLVQLWSAFTS